MEKILFLGSLVCIILGCQAESGIGLAVPMLGIMLFLLGISIIGASAGKKTRKRRRSV